VSFDLTSHSSGWVGDDHPSWLANAIEEASCSFYGASTASFGDGASIPFMSMLREQFPSTPYLVTGLLGPNSNAHGPDENLYVPAVKALTASVAHVLSAAATGAAGSRAEDAVADLLGE
jgi:acetylornithine deacetylase/succinyl-diaminopimelate desuccinylase-like protein